MALAALALWATVAEPNAPPAEAPKAVTLSAVPQSEYDALVGLYNASSGANWTDNSGWLSDPDVDNWYGVTVTSGHVTWLDLGSNNLIGSILPELGNLASLQGLSLSGNQLSGAIPPELGNLTKLTELYLQGNGLQGPVPAAITNLVNLNEADLGHNALWSDDPAVVAFLNDKDPDWAATQTVAPQNLRVTCSGGSSVFLAWDHIGYTGDAGRYELGVSTTPGGPYDLVGATANKLTTTLTVTLPSAPRTWYLAARTVTEPHDSCATVVSGWSDHVRVNTQESCGPYSVWIPLCVLLRQG